MRFSRTFFFGLLFISFTHYSFSQNKLSSHSKKAIKLFNQSSKMLVQRKFEEAIHLLNQSLQKDSNFIEAHLRLANIYRLLLENNLALTHYEIVLGIAPNTPRYLGVYSSLANMYLNSGEYLKADTIVQKALDFNTRNSRLNNELKALKQKTLFAIKGMENTVKGFNPHPLPGDMHVFLLEYFPALTVDQNEIYFTARAGFESNQDENVFVSRKNDKGLWGKPEAILGKVNSPFNEGTVSISADGRMMVFTSCTGRQSYGSCDLYMTKKEGKEWLEPVNLGNKVNSGSWESQPSLSADGRTLYFVSNRLGGYGKRDIWISSMHSDGTWGIPHNLGKEINTLDDETSPFIHPDGQTLFFASKGHLGFGGFDIFTSKRSKHGWSKPQNLGYPINTHEDQVSLVVSVDAKMGYYSQEEKVNGKTISSKIYQFDILDELGIKIKSNYLHGFITSKDNRTPLEAKIDLYDLETKNLMQSVRSNKENGEYYIVLTEGSEYALYVNTKGYLFASETFDYVHEINSKPLRKDFSLELIKSGAYVVLKHLYFDLGKSELKEKSVTELDRLVQFMISNPKVHIEIAGHTDSQGSKDYNLALSKDRTKAVFDYMVKAGVSRFRLRYQSYGESRSIAPNDTETNRAKNRRIELTVVK